MSQGEAMTFPTASIIIVCYNEMQFLEGCLAPLMQQDYPGEYQVILVDNASTDGSAEFVRASFPDVQVVEPSENLGFANGNNYGAQFAHGDVIAFLNSDTRVSGPDWLRELVRPLTQDTCVGLTTSKIVLMDQPGQINACGLDVSLTGIATCRHFGKPSDSIVEDEDIAAVSGGAFAVRTQLFRELGGFDSHIWIYQEDTDLSWRARLAGYRCVLAARSVVAHSYTFKMPPRKTRDIERTRYLMLAKNLSPTTLVALIPLLLLTELITWGWAMLQGPKYVIAKGQAMGWTLLNVRHLMRAHEATQALRRDSDAVVLRSHIRIPAIETVSDGLTARMAISVVTPLAAFGALSLKLVGVAVLQSPPALESQ